MIEQIQEISQIENDEEYPLLKISYLSEEISPNDETSSFEDGLTFFTWTSQEEQFSHHVGKLFNCGDCACGYEDWQKLKLHLEEFNHSKLDVIQKNGFMRSVSIIKAWGKFL